MVAPPPELQLQETIISMRIITLNVNGLRSAASKGFFTWMAQQNADVICLQEIKIQHDQIKPEWLQPENYQGYFFPAEKKGYSGVAIYTRHKPHQVRLGLGWPLADSEGRYIQIDLDKLSIASLYLPSGSSGEERQALKFEFMAKYLPHLQAQIAQTDRHIILCGDWNIAHKAIDLKNWRSNQKNSGFLPEEREWLDQLFNQIGWVDAFRVINQEPDHYTWWSNRGQAYAKNVGWRIDYQIISPGLKSAVHNVHIDKSQRFSDHAPLIIDYTWDW